VDLRASFPWLSRAPIGDLVGGPVCADPVRVSLRPADTLLAFLEAL
jgi:hypothetical protein